MARMGYEGQLFYGVAGATASSQVLNSTDATVSYDQERGNTTSRGDGSAPPINTESVSIRNLQVTFTMLNRAADSILTALRAAAAGGTPVALRVKDHASGTGVDADFNVACEKGLPLRGEQTFNFTCTPHTVRSLNN